MDQPDKTPNQAQAELWNARTGEVWVEQQQMLDRLFLPFERLLADVVPTDSVRNVLDIGCGAGATSLAIARRLTGRGGCTGVDISAPLIEAARSRAEVEGVPNVRFATGDAQIHPFAPASFDAVISRFGVMFFDDPEAAFANLRRAVSADGGLTLIAWRSPDENPFMVAAERAAAPFLPELTERDPEAPGQFAFADAGRIRRILRVGWRDIDIQPVDVPCLLSTDDLNTYVNRMGRVGTLLPDLDERIRTTVSAAVRRAFESYETPDGAEFTASCWLVRARAV